MPPPPRSRAALAVVVAAVLLIVAATPQRSAVAHGPGDVMASCTGTVGECVDNAAVARRELGGSGYIGYGATGAGNTTAGRAAPPTPTPAAAPPSPSAGASDRAGDLGPWRHGLMNASSMYFVQFSHLLTRSKIIAP
ncbi:hypothetical protein C2845_PM07G33870 [Panicum miliaceum]|uniref:Uncharacterized protein n=1 Tax=Panicum miliaceum TaxID=4540 RepID=A0A3L6SK26_PANMI|nr:hypothetical protein C2845_PM07G33870 [Panicum miliaceum]